MKKPEARLIRDLSMPHRDWRQYDSPAWRRLGYTHPISCLRDTKWVPRFLRTEAA